MKLLLTLSFLLLLATTPGTKANMPTGNTTATDSVYICTGQYSKKYHKKEDCKGLENCSQKVVRITEDSAKAIGRTSCNWCNPKKPYTKRDSVQTH